MSQCGDQNDIFVYVLNVFIGIAIAVYFLPCKKITLYIVYTFIPNVGIRPIKSRSGSSDDQLAPQLPVHFRY